MAAIVAVGARGRGVPGCCSPWRSAPRAGASASRRAGRRAGLVRRALLARSASWPSALANLDRITDTVDEQWATLTGAEYDVGGGGADLEPRPLRAPRLLARGDRPLPGVARDRRGHRQLRARVHRAQARAEALALRAQHVPAGARRGRLRGRGPARGLLPDALRGRGGAPAPARAGTRARAGHHAGDRRLLRRSPELRLARGDPGRGVARAGATARGARGRRAAGRARDAPAERTRAVARGGLGGRGSSRRSRSIALVPAYLSVRYSTARRSGPRPTWTAPSRTSTGPARSTRPRSIPTSPRGGSPSRPAATTRRAQAFEHSLTVEDNWLAHYELALIATGRGRFGRRGRRPARGPRPECA